jgi:hypothetical protein
VGGQDAVFRISGRAGFFFKESSRIEKWHADNTSQSEWNTKQVMAGFQKLDRFGVLNCLPGLCASFHDTRQNVLTKYSVVECYIELQRLAVYAECQQNYQDSL